MHSMRQEVKKLRESNKKSEVMKTGDIHMKRPGKAAREITRNLRGESERKAGVAHGTLASTKQNTLI